MRVVMESVEVAMNARKYRMNSRYLYRGKRIDNGEWVVGYLLRPYFTDSEKGIESYYFHAVDKNGWYSECIVFADTVCQCTGREDEWEHDIFICEGEAYEVLFCEDSLSWIAVSVFSSESINLGEFGQKDYVRVGNAISALEKIQQYRAVGTPDEMNQLKENGAFTGVELAELAIMQMKLKEYLVIGTPEECRAAVEKQKEMKSYCDENDCAGCAYRNEDQEGNRCMNDFIADIDWGEGK